MWAGWEALSLGGYMGIIAQQRLFAARPRHPRHDDAEWRARTLAHVLETIIVAFAITSTDDGGGESGAVAVVVSPRAAVAMDAVCTCLQVSDVLGLMLVWGFDLRVSSLLIVDVAMRRGWWRATSGISSEKVSWVHQPRLSQAVG